MTGPAANNPYNLVLRDRAAALSIAYRAPIAPGCQLAPIEAPSPAVQRKRLLRALINCSVAGDNLIIPTIVGRKLIYEIKLWNVSAQTLAWYQGPSAGGILQDRLTDFPALTGFVLGFNGNFSQPHFEIENGQPFVLNLQNSTQVDGFVRYTIDIGNF